MLQDTPEEVLAALDAANGKDQEGIAVATSYGSKKSTYTLEIPPESIEENESYTFAFWTKFSYTYPARLFDNSFLENNEELVLGRFANEELSEVDDKQQARFAALVWRNGAYQLQAFDEVDNTLHQGEPIQTELRDIEGRWVWSVVSYSSTEDKVVLGLYIAETDRWEVQEIEVQKKLPIKTLKFQSGPSFGLRSINGVFFDTRFEFEYFANQEEIKNFFDTEVNFPKDYNDSDGSSFDGETVINLLSQDAFFDATIDAPGTPIDLKDRYGNLREYTVRGWFKFDNSDLENEDRLVFRFTINNPA